MSIVEIIPPPMPRFVHVPYAPVVYHDGAIHFLWSVRGESVGSLSNALSSASSASDASHNGGSPLLALQRGSFAQTDCGLPSIDDPGAAVGAVSDASSSTCATAAVPAEPSQGDPARPPQWRFAHRAPGRRLPPQEGMFHTSLVGWCEYIAVFATAQPLPMPPPPVDLSNEGRPVFQLFFGQLRFEATAAELRWLVFVATGACVTNAVRRGIGCFVADFASAGDLALARTLRGSVLYDHNGVWVARAPEQQRRLAEYIARGEFVAERRHRLPKGLVVVEEVKGQIKQQPQ